MQQTLLTLAGLALAFGGFEATSRVRDRLGLPDSLRAKTVEKWVPLAALVAFVVLVEGRLLASIGWRPIGPRPFAVETTVGLAAMLGSSVLANPLLSAVGADDALAEGMASFADASLPDRLFVAFTAGVTEEPTVHGYPIERLLALTGSPLLAGGVSFVGFTLGHLGERWSRSAVLAIAVPAAVSTALYLVFRSLPVLIAVHALNDAIGLVLADRYA